MVFEAATNPQKKKTEISVISGRFFTGSLVLGLKVGKTFVARRLLLMPCKKKQRKAKLVLQQLPAGLNSRFSQTKPRFVEIK